MGVRPTPPLVTWIYANGGMAVLNTHQAHDPKGRSIGVLWTEGAMPVSGNRRAPSRERCFIVLLYLANHATAANRGQVHFGRRAIANDTGFPERSVQDCLFALETLGLIVRTGKVGRAVRFMVLPDVVEVEFGHVDVSPHVSPDVSPHVSPFVSPHGLANRKVEVEGASRGPSGRARRATPARVASQPARTAAALGGAAPTAQTQEPPDWVSEPQPARPIAARSETKIAGDEGTVPTEDPDPEPLVILDDDGVPLTGAALVRAAYRRPEPVAWPSTPPPLEAIVAAAAHAAGADERDANYLEGQAATETSQARDVVPA